MLVALQNITWYLKNFIIWQLFILSTNFLVEPKSTYVIRQNRTEHNLSIDDLFMADQTT